MARRFASTLAGLLLVLALAAPAGAASGSPFKGVWTSTDTDGSAQLLIVSAGSSPAVVYEDFYASGCDRFGGPATHWVAAGQGSVEGFDLLVSFHKSGCGTFLQGGYEDLYTYDPDADTLVDAFGIVWQRAR